MYLLNITFNIERNVFDLWRQWLQKSCMRQVQAIKSLDDVKVFQLLSHTAESEVTYTVQLSTSDLGDIMDFEQKVLPELKQELFLVFGAQVLFFVTHLKEVNEFE